MIIYMVLRQKEDGSTEYRLGGGSSAPSAPKLYDSLARARVYARRNPNYYIAIIDTDKLENTI